MNYWTKIVCGMGILLLFLFVVGISIVSSLTEKLNERVSITKYDFFSEIESSDMNAFYGSSGSTINGEATVFDMLFNRECPKIYEPKTYNFINGTFNPPFAVSIVTCGGQVRWNDDD